MNVMSAVVSLAAALGAEVVAPSRCAACDGRVSRLSTFCPACASTVDAEERTPAGFAAFRYGGAVATAVVRMKYHRRPDLARPLGDLLARAIATRAGGALPPVVVVPVPLHPARLAERGFNQSALIAQRVARSLRAPLHAVALARVRDTAPQAALDRAGRANNLVGAFQARQPHVLRRQSVLLVDDVRTTGATLDACARVTREAGALWIAHAVVAQAPAAV